MKIIDSVDVQIVRVLCKDTRKSSEALANELNLSAATFGRRLRTLFKSDLLRLVGVVDSSNFGFPVTAVIALDVAHEQSKLAIEKLINRPEIIFA